MNSETFDDVSLKICGFATLVALLLWDTLDINNFILFSFFFSDFYFIFIFIFCFL